MTRERQDMPDADASPIRPQPWNELPTADAAEAWIDAYNRHLQQHIDPKNVLGTGVRLDLIHGGQIYLHTSDNAILLDLTPDALWVAPVIAAATGVTAPQTALWVLPHDVLIELLLGLNSLIAATLMVANHHYRAKKF